MRKFLLSAALAASTLAVSAPAAAHWVPPPQGHAYGYDNYGQARRLQARVDHLQRGIVRLDRRNIISGREARSLMGEARTIEYRLRKKARNGLGIREQRDINYSIARLERRVAYEARDGNRYAYNDRHGYRDRDRDGINDRHDRFIDRDRDGRNDRYEDDHGYRHD